MTKEATGLKVGSRVRVSNPDGPFNGERGEVFVIGGNPDAEKQSVFNGEAAVRLDRGGAITGPIESFELTP